MTMADLVLKDQVRHDCFPPYPALAGKASLIFLLPWQWLSMSHHFELTGHASRKNNHANDF